MRTPTETLHYILAGPSLRISPQGRKRQENSNNNITINKVGNFICKASIHPELNFSKGLIFLREFDLTEEDLPSFKKDLKDNCGIADI